MQFVKVDSPAGGRFTEPARGKTIHKLISLYQVGRDAEYYHAYFCRNRVGHVHGVGPSASTAAKQRPLLGQLGCHWSLLDGLPPGQLV